MEFLVQNLEDLNNVAPEILKQLKHSVVLLQGDLGAGKTTLVKALMNILNSDENVNSPTFSLVNEYPLGEESIYHLDLYRIETLDEALDMGIEDYLEFGKYVFIEWPKVIEAILPEDLHLIKIEVLDNSTRRIKLH